MIVVAISVNELILFAALPLFFEQIGNFETLPIDWINCTEQWFVKKRGGQKRQVIISKYKRKKGGKRLVTGIIWSVRCDCLNQKKNNLYHKKSERRNLKRGMKWLLQPISRRILFSIWKKCQKIRRIIFKERFESERQKKTKEKKEIKNEQKTQMRCGWRWGSG